MPYFSLSFHATYSWDKLDAADKSVNSSPVGTRNFAHEYLLNNAVIIHARLGIYVVFNYLLANTLALKL